MTAPSVKAGNPSPSDAVRGAAQLRFQAMHCWARDLILGRGLTKRRWPGTPWTAATRRLVLLGEEHVGVVTSVVEQKSVTASRVSPWAKYWGWVQGYGILNGGRSPAWTNARLTSSMTSISAKAIIRNVPARPLPRKE